MTMNGMNIYHKGVPDRDPMDEPVIDLMAKVDRDRVLEIAMDSAVVGTATWRSFRGDPPSSRPSWDHTFKRQYEALEDRSTCPRLHVACIAEKDHQILASGFNGAPRGLPHCTDVGCLVVENHCLRAVHDAQNLMAQAARLGISLLGATFRSRYLPCTRCALLLIQVGIVEIVYEEVYKNSGAAAIDFLCAANVQLRVIE